MGLWSTPRASDAEKGGPKQAFGAGGEPLTSQAINQSAGLWQTPSVGDVTGGHASRSGTRKDEMLLNGQADFLSSRLALETYPLGERSPNALLSAYLRYRATTCSVLRSERRALLLLAIRRAGRGWTRRQASLPIRASFRRQLNPFFVEWLMGWPAGWTLLADAGSSAFVSSETEFSRFKQLSRFALSQLGSLPEAPPAQLSLFG